MTTNPTTEWEERFDERFLSVDRAGRRHWPTMNNISLLKYIKGFIKSELSSTEARVKEQTARDIVDEVTKRISYLTEHKSEQFKNGFSGAESGDCCERCVMRDEHFTGRADALKALVGCRNPFQLESTCQCHIPFRKVAVKSQLLSLDILKSSITKKYSIK